MTKVVLVDINDNQLGTKDKIAAHLGAGDLHRAFTTLVFNSAGETLIAQRSAEKMLWPLYWDNTCASHPLPGEDYVTSGERRLTEELGFTCPLKIVDRFQYQEKFGDIGSENEVCTTLIGEYNGNVHPIPTEVVDYKWISVSELQSDMVKNPEKYTIWFKIALNRLIEQGKIKQKD